MNFVPVVTRMGLGELIEVWGYDMIMPRQLHPLYIAHPHEGRSGKCQRVGLASEELNESS